MKGDGAMNEEEERKVSDEDANTHPCLSYERNLLRVKSSVKIIRSKILQRSFPKTMAKRKSAKKAKTQGICAYCGRIEQLSVDHVIPQCLFSGNLPGDIPKVYACSLCNTTVKSGNDTYLRDMLLTDIDSSQHPLARPVTRCV